MLRIGTKVRSKDGPHAGIVSVVTAYTEIGERGLHLVTFVPNRLRQQEHANVRKHADTLMAPPADKLVLTGPHQWIAPGALEAAKQARGLP